MALVTEKAILDRIKDPEPTPPKGPTIPKLNTNPYVRTKIHSEKTPSPIEILHNKEKSLSGRFPLAEYYAQGRGKGRLGYRNNDVVGFDQPFVIRDIGDRWGKFDSFGLGDSKFGNTIEPILRFGAGLVDSIGGAVLGRNPSDYIGNGLGAYERTGKFLITPRGVAFLAKQSLLKRRNKN